MVTPLVTRPVTISGTDYTYYEFVGLSTDSKPTTGVLNGSTFFAMDTKKKYMFNADATTWVEI